MGVRITSVENEYPEPESEWWFWKFYHSDKPQGLCCVYGYICPSAPKWLRYSKRIDVNGYLSETPNANCSYDDDIIPLINNTDNPIFQEWFNGLMGYNRDFLKKILPFND